MAKTAQKVINLAHSWLGKNEKDGSHKEIIDIYNSYGGALPRGIKMQYGWSWCACTWSALAIKLGYTDIMPIEISCGNLVESAKKMGIWLENDAVVPRPGDAILFDWQDGSNGKDNSGWPDHIGLVDYVNQNSGYFTTIEGNYSDAVKKRTVSINGRYIRGFIRPKYDADESQAIVDVTPTNWSIDVIAHEVISGKWGNGDVRKAKLTASGYDYAAIQKRVNEIVNGSAVKIPEDPNTDLNQPYIKKVISTCYTKYGDISLIGTYLTLTDLYLRNDAGTNKKALTIIPKGTRVSCNGSYNMYNGNKWLYVNFIMNGTYYCGFSSGSSKYLLKV